jgi:predicted ATP-dependent endonuclease of OLD family
MKLDKIEIRNFRSIKQAEIAFDQNCLVLLGKNEAGKSNVLKAIAAIFGQYVISEKDKRKKIDNERIKAEERYIRAHISLSQDDLNTVNSRFKAKYTGSENLVFVSKIRIEDYIQKAFSTFFIHLQIGEGQNTNIDIVKTNEEEFKLKQTISLVNNGFVQNNENPADMTFLILSVIFELYTEKPIRCHFWQYQESYLLPGNVDINTFINNPASCKPLEHIFQLCGRDNILEEFNNAKAEDGDYVNLLEQVSKQVTETFQDIWKDMKDTTIQFIPDGSQILIKLSNKAKYNFEDRSDGFKKFISILLMLSTQSRAKKIVDNDIILIDEPDQSLYPTSARFLRDELLSISKNAKVVYSTHSHYMIDSENVSRHLLVEKSADITCVNKPDKNAPYSQDELLRNAIGSSIFECIKEKNIIFEGYLDKKLFDKYIEAKQLGSDFESFGKIFLWGISGVEAVSSILQAANKKFIVVADSDTTSNDKRNVFGQNNPECKDCWLSYGEVKSEIVTMEDYFRNDFIESEIKKQNPNFNYDPSKKALLNIEKAVNNVKEKKQEIKSSLVTEMKVENIKDEYNNFLLKLKERLMALR